MTEQPFYCGFAAIVGRPNVGKSTLINSLVRQKVSIVTPKPQTTRNSIRGMVSDDTSQIILVDTPGMHTGSSKAINRYLNKSAASAISDVDVVVFVVEALHWDAEDAAVLAKLPSQENVILAVNKVDSIKDKDQLLPFLERLDSEFGFKTIIPISALANDNTERLLALIRERLPESPPLFPLDQVTDQSERFLASEIIREKLMMRLRQELPYSLAVTIESFQRDNNLVKINAVIWVERESQKGIIIGNKGTVLKEIGSKARLDIERQLDCKVYLDLWVKVKEGWSENERILKTLGFDTQ